MTLMDDFRRKTEDGLKTLKETAEGIAFNVEKQARIAGKKMDIMRIQRKVQKLYAEVGEYVYGEFMLERQVAMEAPFLKDRMTAVSEMKAEIREIEEEIEEVRRTQPPGHEDRSEAKRKRRNASRCPSIKEVFMLGQFKNKQLYIELRPRCPKCQKEFMLDLRKFTAGGAHSCHACGTVTQFDAALAEKVQGLIHDLEEAIRDVFDSFTAE